MILVMPLPQMLKQMTMTIAETAINQLAEQLVIAELERIRPMEMMMGPVTIGGKKFTRNSSTKPKAALSSSLKTRRMGFVNIFRISTAPTIRAAMRRIPDNVSIGFPFFIPIF